MNNFEQLIFQQNPMVLKACFKILTLKTLCNCTDYINIYVHLNFVKNLWKYSPFLKILKIYKYKIFFLYLKICICNSFIYIYNFIIYIWIDTRFITKKHKKIEHTIS